MRLKIAIPLILVGICAVLLPFVSRFKPVRTNSQTAVPTIAANNSTTASDSAREQVTSSGSLSAPSETIRSESNTGTVTTDHENYVANRITELENLAMTGDSNSLATIEFELDSRDPRIQEAAVAAVIQFGSRDAIPALRAAYEHLDDPVQKVRIQKAVDFLELPTQAETDNTAGPANEVGTAN